MKNKKTLLEIIAMSLEANNFDSVFNVPGFGGTEVLDILQKNNKLKTFINLNEEAAFSISYGVSSNGKRSALLIKSQGFAKAANAITSSLSTETTSANIVFVFDDTQGKSSDNILSTTKLINGTETPLVKIGKSPSIDIGSAILLSEKLKLPVAILIDCKFLLKLYPSNIKKVTPKKLSRLKFSRRVACPILTNYHREVLKVKLTGGKKKILPPKIKDIEQILPERIKIAYVSYKPFFDEFKKYRPSFVSGDAGTSALFSFAPYECIDTCTYMGGSPGMAIGAYIAGIKDAVSITGDFSFFAAGILGLNEAIIHKIPLKVIIFNNGKAQATGGQTVDGALINNLTRSFPESISALKLNDSNPDEVKEKIKNLLSSTNLSILIVET